MIKSIILPEENAKITFEKPISEELIMSIVAAVMYWFWDSTFLCLT